MKYILTLELFDNSINLDNEILLDLNTSKKTVFVYIDPNSNDEYAFFFYKEEDKNDNEYRFLFSINDDFELSNKGIAYKILKVMSESIKRFIELKPNTDMFLYTIDSSELKRKRIYNSIFSKYGFVEYDSYIGKLSNGKSILVKLKKDN